MSCFRASAMSRYPLEYTLSLLSWHAIMMDSACHGTPSHHTLGNQSTLNHLMLPRDIIGLAPLRMRFAREISASRPQRIYLLGVSTHLFYPKGKTTNISQTYQQIVPTLHGNMLHPPRASQVLYNVRNWFEPDLFDITRFLIFSHWLSYYRIVFITFQH